MAQAAITSTEILSDEHYILKKVHFTLTKKDGSTEEQSREVFDHGNAAAALLYNKTEKTVLLTRQFRIATFVNGNPTGMLLETPAGLLEPDEDPADCMLREIREETGYAVTAVQPVYTAYTSAGSLTELIYLFVAEYSRDQKVDKGGGLETEGEEITVVEMPFSEAIHMLERGDIQDAKTIMLLQYALIKGLLAP